MAIGHRSWAEGEPRGRRPWTHQAGDTAPHSKFERQSPLTRFKALGRLTLRTPLTQGDDHGASCRIGNHITLLIDVCWFTRFTHRDASRPCAMTRAQSLSAAGLPTAPSCGCVICHGGRSAPFGDRSPRTRGCMSPERHDLGADRRRSTSAFSPAPGIATDRLLIAHLNCNDRLHASPEVRIGGRAWPRRALRSPA